MHGVGNRSTHETKKTILQWTHQQCSCKDETEDHQTDGQAMPRTWPKAVRDRWRDKANNAPHCEDGEILLLLEKLPARKRQPNLFLGVVRFLYGTAADYSEFRSLAIEHWPTIEQAMLAKRTQTNEVGRCAALLPILASLPEPLNL